MLLPLILVSLSGLFINELSANQLTHNVLPQKYILSIIVDLVAAEFIGNVTIDIRVLEPQISITLHAKELDVIWEELQLRDLHNQIFKVDTYDVDDIQETVQLNFTDVIPPGDYKIFTSFAGSIRSDSMGLYKTSYDYNGKTKYLAVTYLAGTYARMIFPCFDEPFMKATFQIDIYHAAKYKAISNMPENIPSPSSSQIPNFQLTRFQETPVMSTYLLAFVVHEDYVAYTEPTSIISVYATEPEIHLTKHALQFGTKVLNKLEEWFDRNNQIPKIDFINIPDFYGAMENWGLITFKDPYLFKYEDETIVSIETQQFSSLIIAHEMIHMWFGNEVTPTYWNYIWLSEGFTTYFEYFICSQIERDWDLMNQFIIDNNQKALSLDDKIDTQSMSANVYTPDEIADVFDYRAYEKGSAVIRMIQHAIGMNAFQLAIRSYLKERSFNSSTPDDLFDHMQQAIDLENILLPASFKRVFESWSNTAGYPLVTVTRDYKTGSQISFDQKRFIYYPGEYHTDAYLGQYIPITITTQTDINFDDTKPNLWMKEFEPKKIVPMTVSNTSWIIVNKQVTGFYRVNYDRTNWNLLKQTLHTDSFTAIHVLNRAQLIDDSINLAAAHEQDIEVALDMLAYLHRETNYVPWATAVKVISYLDRKLRSNKFYHRFELLIQNLTSKAYSSVRVTEVGLQHMPRMHRLNVGRLACVSGLPACIEDLHVLVNGMIKENKSIIEELKSFVYCASARNSDDLRELLLDHVWKLYNSSRDNNLPEIKRLFVGLGCSRNETFIESFARLSIDANNLLPEDRNVIFNAVSTGTFFGTTTAIALLTNNFTEVISRFYSITNIFNKSFGDSIIGELYNNYRNFENSNQHLFNDTILSAINEISDIIIKNRAWEMKHENAASEWLDLNAPSTAATHLLLSIYLLVIIGVLGVLSF